MDKNLYEIEAKGPKHLGDTTTYVALSGPPELIPIKDKFIEIFNREKWFNKGFLAKRLFTDLCFDMNKMKDEIICCRMFFYPKIHKPTLSFRPLCSSPGTITYLTSKYLAYELQCILRLVPSACRNSADIILELEKTILPNDGVLLSADIVNMYPSIDIIEGIQSMRWTLLHFKFHIEHVTFLTNLAGWVLRNNFVKFGNKFYKQIKGVAMGTPFAVAFASMHIFHIETISFNILMSSPNYVMNSIRIFKRYIDDFFMWIKNHEIAIEFMKILNSQRNSIKIEYQIDNTSVNFLDITIFKGSRFANDNILDSKAFEKPLNNHLFLPPISFHLPSIFDSWIGEYINRFRLICSNELDFIESCKQFRLQLIARGYDPIRLGDSLQPSKSRELLLHRTQTNHSKWINNHLEPTDGVLPPSVRFHLTYDKNTAANLQLIKEALQPSNTYKKALDVTSRCILGDGPSINLSISNAQNLRKLLVSNTFTSPDEEGYDEEEEND